MKKRFRLKLIPTKNIIFFVIKILNSESKQSREHFTRVIDLVVKTGFCYISWVTNNFNNQLSAIVQFKVGMQEIFKSILFKFNVK